MARALTDTDHVINQEEHEEHEENEDHDEHDGEPHEREHTSTLRVGSEVTVFFECFVFFVFFVVEIR